MKTKIIMMTALVALLATGCGKDKIATRVNLFADNMATAGHGAKIFMNPNSGDFNYDAEWVAGEPISIKGDGAATQYDVVKSGTDYYLANVEATGTRYAIYPGTTTANGNDVTVVNNGATGGSITINELAVNFHDYYSGADVIFPMAAKSRDNDQELWFHHLTAGMILNIKARTTAISHVDRLEVTLFYEDETFDDSFTVPGLSGCSYTVKWADQGLPLPGGAIGGGSSRDVKYSSVMKFNLKDEVGGTDFVEIDNGDGITFCMPVTVTGVNRITVNGYSDANALLFTKTTLFNSALFLNLNTMYRLPQLEVE